MSYVTGPELEGDINYYDVKLSNFRRWLNAARDFQSRRVIDNGETDYFVYKPEERNRLTELIRIKVFGIKGEQQGYSREETRDALNIKRKICEVSGGQEAVVQLNTIYLSTFTYDGDSEEKFIATEIPVFVILQKDGTRCFIDGMCVVFKSVEDVLSIIGLRFKGGIVYPEGLCHKADKDTGKATLLYEESKGSSLLNRAMDVLETTMTVASIVIGVASVAVCMPLPLYLKSAVLLIRGKLAIAGMVSAAFAVTKTSIDLSFCYRSGQMEDASGKVIFIIAMALSTASQGLTLAVRSSTMQVKGAKAMFGGWFKSVFYTLRVSATLSTFVSITHSIYAMYKKGKWTVADCYRLSMSFFSLYNILMTPWTIEAILESEHMREIERMEAEMKIDEMPGIFKLCKEIYKEGRELACTAVPVLRTLVTISKSEHFVHQTSGILRSEAAESDVNPHSDESVIFTSELNLSKGSLAVSAKTWDSMGKEVLKLSIARMLRNNDGEKYILERLQRAFPNDSVARILNEAHESSEMICQDPINLETAASAAAINFSQDINQQEAIIAALNEHIDKCENCHMEDMMHAALYGLPLPVAVNLIEESKQGKGSSYVRAANSLIERLNGVTKKHDDRRGHSSHIARKKFHAKQHEIKELLCNIFETEDISSIKVAEKLLFTNIRVVDSYRMHRALAQVELKVIRARLEICNEAGIREHVHTPYDFVCVVKMTKDDAILSANSLMETMRTVLSLPRASLWQSPLRMTYHYKKHEKQFRDDENVAITPEIFFKKLRVFFEENTFQGILPQCGIPRRLQYYACGKHLSIMDL